MLIGRAAKNAILSLVRQGEVERGKPLVDAALEGERTSSPSYSDDLVCVHSRVRCRSQLSAGSVAAQIMGTNRNGGMLDGTCTAIFIHYSGLSSWSSVWRKAAVAALSPSVPKPRPIGGD